jgi:hypothetical protein
LIRSVRRFALSGGSEKRVFLVILIGLVTNTYDNHHHLFFMVLRWFRGCKWSGKETIKIVSLLAVRKTKLQIHPLLEIHKFCVDPS